MRIAQISSHDLAGRIFNGHDLQIELNQRGMESRQYVMVKKSGDDATVSCTNKFEMEAWRRVREAEQALSMDTLLFSNSARFIERDPFYQSADIVHFQIFYGGWISLFDFARMAGEKQCVWTIHDLWPLTGHCIYPMYPGDCPKWRTGCASCLYALGDCFPMRQDKAGQMWKIKQRLYQQVDPDVVVSTAWTERYVRESPLTRHFSRIHCIPFGIHLDQYGHVSREEARERLGIPQNSLVIAFRTEGSSQYAVKGSPHIWNALRGCDQEVTLLAVGQESVPEDISRKFPTVELGWINDTKIMADFYAACDIFLMPSEAETFGLMSIEAMASARPVIVFEGTVLADVTCAPECGIAVPYRNSDALRGAICRLIDYPEERQRRGQLGRHLAEQNYRFESYVDRHIELYRNILEKGRS